MRKPESLGFSRETKRVTDKMIASRQFRAIKARQEYAKAVEPLNFLEISIHGTDRFKIIPLSDIHFGSESTDYEELKKIVEYIETHDNVYVVMLGDEIEGSKSEYKSTIEDHRIGNEADQIRGLKSFVLDKIAHKIIAAVGYFGGHTGWSYDASGLDPWSQIYDEYGIPVLLNGSRIKLTYGVNKKYRSTVDVAHYFSSKSSKDTLDAVRTHLKKDKGSDRADFAVMGHIHQVAVGIEYYSGLSIPVILVNSGTIKGTNINLPSDRFASKAGLDTLPGKMGQMLLFDKGRRSATSTIAKGDIRYDAMEFADKYEKLATEARAYAQERSTSEVQFLSKNSVSSLQLEGLPEPDEDDEESEAEEGTIESSAYTAQGLAPLYDTLVYNIISEWPILFLPIANVRMGSSYEGTSVLKEMISNFIAGNPHVFVAFLGNVLDKEVPGKRNREAILDEVSSLVEMMGSDHVLALLLDSVMRNPKWRRAIGHSLPVAPGTKVSTDTGVPLIVGGSTLDIYHGPQVRTDRKPKHSMLLLDGLKNMGSHSKPLAGLNSYYDSNDDQGHDVLISGHLGHAGVGTYVKDGKEVDYIDVGHLSPFWGSGNNVHKTSPGGQGVIIHEDMRIPTGEWKDTVEFFNAFLALIAARKLGMI